MKSITGKHQVWGVIGDPISHTLSPAIHNTLAEQLGHEHMVYVPFHVKGEALGDAIRGAYALGIQGLNVTMPHKQEVLKYLVAIDEKAKQAKAVNTLVYDEGGYKGYNTDINGLGLAMERNGMSWKGKHVAIIGSGGAAYAACLCVAEDAASISLYNRTKSKAEDLKAYIQSLYPVPLDAFGMDDEVGKVDIVIQTTGVGMGNLKDSMPGCSERLLCQAEAAIDMIYSPWETPFLRCAREKGVKGINGFDMLYYQGVEAYEKIKGCHIEKEVQIDVKNRVLEATHLFEKK